MANTHRSIEVRRVGLSPILRLFRLLCLANFLGYRWSTLTSLVVPSTPRIGDDVRTDASGISRFVLRSFCLPWFWFSENIRFVRFYYIVMFITIQSVIGM